MKTIPVLMALMLAGAAVAPAFTSLHGASQDVDRASPDAERGRFTIASFNLKDCVIQTDDEARIDLVADVLSMFDVTALQSIPDEAALDRILSALNVRGWEYDILLGSPTESGRYEHAMVFRTDILSPLNEYTFDDSNEGLFRRDPFVVRFELIDVAFDIVLINVTIDSETAPNEKAAIPVAVDDARSKFSDEADIIVLGSLNHSCPSVPGDTGEAMGRDDYVLLLDSASPKTEESTPCFDARIIAAHYSDRLLWEEADVLQIEPETPSRQSESELYVQSLPGFSAVVVVEGEEEAEKDGTVAGGFCFFSTAGS